MRAYYGVFEALVELGTDPSSNSLSFDLLSEGTLPHVELLSPKERTDEGLPLLSFPRLLVGRTASLPLVLRNEGILPATLELSRLRAEEGFSCLAAGRSVTLEPMSELPLDVVFRWGGWP